MTNFGDIRGIVRPERRSGLPALAYNRAWNPLIYKVDNADGIGPASKATRILMRYESSGIPAATLYEAREGYRVAAFGFPLETSAQMGEVLRTVLQKFEGK